MMSSVALLYRVFFFPTPDGKAVSRGVRQARGGAPPAVWHGLFDDSLGWKTKHDGSRKKLKLK